MFCSLSSQLQDLLVGAHNLIVQLLNSRRIFSKVLQHLSQLFIFLILVLKQTCQLSHGWVVCLLLLLWNHHGLLLEVGILGLDLKLGWNLPRRHLSWRHRVINWLRLGLTH